MSTQRRAFADFAPPRRVSGGLRARSTRGAIGRSWWSRRFLDVLESFALGTRLTRGRSYARAGQVLSLDVAPGVVTAVVQGSRPRPYQVAIRLRPIGERAWSRLENLLAAQALFSARLLAGDVPPELEEVCADAGAPLFPSAIDELDLRCDCPDIAVPCKHLAAAFYLLAEAFDADPFQLLHWRGRQRDRLLTRLRTLRTGAADVGADTDADAGGGAVADPDGAGSAAGDGDGTAGPATAVRTDEAPPIGAEPALADLPGEPVDAMVDRYWVAPVPLPSRAPVLPTEPELVLRQLGPPAAEIGGPGLTERLRRAYAGFAAR